MNNLLKRLKQEYFNDKVLIDGNRVEFIMKNCVYEDGNLLEPIKEIWDEIANCSDEEKTILVNNEDDYNNIKASDIDYKVKLVDYKISTAENAYDFIYKDVLWANMENFNPVIIIDHKI